MFSFCSGPRIWSLRDVDFLPVGSFKFFSFPVDALTQGEKGYGQGLLAAGSPEAAKAGHLVSWEPGHDPQGPR